MYVHRDIEISLRRCLEGPPEGYWDKTERMFRHSQQEGKEICFRRDAERCLDRYCDSFETEPVWRFEERFREKP